ncbi:MAG TPA: GNAT family N-acetyltransferase [Dongiaceae bacterium]|nr:GNAT family N-acetyltransferase [Dongiaceae bacterium]
MTVQTQALLRAAGLQDADAISRVIADALRQTNAADYGADVIARMTTSYNAPRVGLMIRGREMFVAELEDEIVGVIGYSGGTVRSLFIAPAHQGIGVGRQLLASVESRARHAAIRSLTVAASLTAIGFYRRCGFATLRPVDSTGIAMMLMHKWLVDIDEPTLFWKAG